MNTPSLSPVNLTVIGGFLGTGKTTLVNRILAASHSVRFAVMVNDFGALNIDESLITKTDGQVTQLANGCICCSLAGGLVEAMINLMKFRDEFDHILIEASGVSNPSRIMDFARIDQDLRPGLTVVLVDTTRLTEQLDDQRLHETLHDQLSSADIFLLTKTDLASEEEVSHVKTTLNDFQPRVPVTALLSDNADLAQLLVINEFKENQLHHHDGNHDDNHSGHHHDHDHHDHDHSLGFNSVSFVATKAIARQDFARICKRFSHVILRGKGIIHFQDESMIWQQAGRFIDYEPLQDDAIKSSADESRMVIIAIEELDDVFDALHKIGFTPYLDAN